MAAFSSWSHSASSSADVDDHVEEHLALDALEPPIFVSLVDAIDFGFEFGQGRLPAEVALDERFELGLD